MLKLLKIGGGGRELYRLIACLLCAVALAGCMTMGDDYGTAMSKAVAAQRGMMEKYVADKRFGQALPRLEGAALDVFLKGELTAAQKEAIRAGVAREFDRCRGELVIPQWIAFKNAKIRADVSALAAAAQASAATNGFAASRANFEAAREIIWRESVDATLGGVPVREVNGPVHAAAIDLLDTEVNTAEWPIVRREMRFISQTAIDGARPDEGLERIRKYPHIRAYTKALDDRVEAVIGELARLGVPKRAADALSGATRKFMDEAANLADSADKTRSRTVAARPPAPVDDSVCRRLLEEYRAALLHYDCTDANTAKIIDWLAKKIAQLIAEIERPAPEPARTVVDDLRLGATALNRRMDALRAELVKELEAAVAQNEAFAAEMAALVDGGDIASARRKCLAAMSDPDASPAVKAIARDMLVAKVYPALWARAEKELKEKTGEFGAAGKCVEGVAWIAAYSPAELADVADGEPDADVDVAEPAVRLGAKALAKRIAALKIACASSLVARCASDSVAAGKFDAARAAIRDVALSGDEDFDAKVYAARVGVLDTIVNPKQYEALAAEIDAKVAEFFKSGDFRAMRGWIDAYPYVHDRYPDIVKSYEALAGAMAGLEIKDDEARGYIEELSGRVRTLIEKAKGEWRPEEPVDLTALETALDQFERAFLAQYYDRMVASTVRAGIRKEILAMLEASRPVPISTWELNGKLRAHIEETVAAAAGAKAGDFAKLLAELVHRQEYLELVAAMDADFSCDSQIAMAQDAIARQLGDTNPDAHLDANAVLGDYARAMRLLKRGETLPDPLLAAVAFGSVYLDQPAVFARAKELGVSPDAVSPRDPLARTPLLLAVQMGRTGMLRRLAEAGASAKAVDAAGNTAVHYAVRRGNIAVLKAMLGENDVNAANKKGETALFTAARRNQIPLVDALVEAKADVSAKNLSGFTAFDAACIAGSRGVLDSLAAAGAAYGPAQLALAATNDCLAVVQWLVRNGVDVNGEGVMAAAEPDSAVWRYLVGEGGIPVDAGMPARSVSAETPPVSGSAEDKIRGMLPPGQAADAIGAALRAIAPLNEVLESRKEEFATAVLASAFGNDMPLAKFIVSAASEVAAKKEAGK